LRDQRVLIVDLPRVLREIIRRILSAPGIDVVAEASGDVDLPELVSATRADVVVMRLENTRLPRAGRRLLVRHPRIRLVGVAADGRDTVTYELSARRRSLGEVSPEALLNAVRGSDTEGTSAQTEAK
jgi:DNA-binding NarL/FixJ family response regulator